MAALAERPLMSTRGLKVVFGVWLVKRPKLYMAKPLAPSRPLRKSMLWLKWAPVQNTEPLGRSMLKRGAPVKLPRPEDEGPLRTRPS